MDLVQFFFNDVSFNLADRTRLKAFIPGIFKANKKKLEHLNYIFCTDDYLLEINRQHLKHDYYTDIITFDSSVQAGLVSGDIFISIDRVRENAKNFDVTFKEEIHRVIFHGVLHLCGYKDKNQVQQSIMRANEDKWLLEYLK